MKKIFPTDKLSKLLIADDVRQEISGKGIIIGYYPDDTIAFPYQGQSISKELPLLIQNLCLLWVFTDGQGDFIATLSVKDPHGNITEIGTQNVQKNPDGAANFIVKLSPFMVTGFGEYNCQLDFGEGHIYKRKFKVINNAK
jgi:hypothetical protein